MADTNARIRKSERKFAVMLVLLLAIMGIAPAGILDYVIVTQAAGEEIDPRILILAIIALTGGFLFMAGGLGMWAFRSSMTAELQRTIGRFVTAMDYLDDGLICISPNSRVLAANPAIQNMARISGEPEPMLGDLFPELSEREITLLLDSKGHTEVERKIYRNGSSMTLRFRSQLEGGLHLVLVSDITEQNVQQRETRRQAQLQFIGRIARGVAHDFNNILCAVSGHAALLERQGMQPEDENSIRSILSETSRGANLARRLMELSRESSNDESSMSVRTMIANTEDLVKVALSTGNHLEYNLDETDLKVSLSASQMEQIVTNLTVLSSDQQASSCTVHINLENQDTGRDGLEPVAMLSIFSTTEDQESNSQMKTAALEEIDRTGGDGVILSVVASQVEEIGGTLLKLKMNGQDVGFRIMFPGEKGTAGGVEGRVVDEAWRKDFQNWTVLLGLHGSDRKNEAIQFAAGESLQLSICDDLPALLTQLERVGAWQIIMVDEGLLATEGDAILRVITRLHPEAALVAMTSSPDEPGCLIQAAHTVHVPKNVSFSEIFSSVQKRLIQDIQP